MTYFIKNHFKSQKFPYSPQNINKLYIHANYSYCQLGMVDHMHGIHSFYTSFDLYRKYTEITYFPINLLFVDPYAGKINRLIEIVIEAYKNKIEIPRIVDIVSSYSSYLRDNVAPFHQLIREEFGEYHDLHHQG